MNRKIKIAACDDDANVLSALPDTLSNVFKDKAEIKVDCFGNESMLLERMKREIYDIIILDISMPGTNGLVLGKKIRAVNPSVEIVYLSGHEEKVFDTFMVSPMAFVRKSAFFTDIAKIADIYLKKHTPSDEKKKLLVKDKDGLFLIDCDRVRYIENFKNMQYIYTEGETEPCTVRLTMHRIFSQLEKASDSFVFVSSGIIVNLSYVCRLNGGVVVLDGGEELTISRRNRESVKTAFFRYLEEQG